MRPYFVSGLERGMSKDLEGPDCADVGKYGLKSRAGRLPGKGGDIRSMQKASAKRAARIRGNKRARRALKREIAEETE